MTHVTKQTAVLLKEKGINVPTDYVYAYSEGDMTISAPTLYEAADWLRSKGVHVYVVPVNLWQQWRMFINLDTYPPQKTRIPDKPMDFETHDLALESGIIHALKNYVK